MKTDLKYKFHYKSNHAQFGFKESIIDKLETITKLIKSDSKKRVLKSVNPSSRTSKSATSF